MAAITREQIGVAFWNLVSAAEGFSATSRKFIHWDQVNDGDQLPFMTMVKTGEMRIRQEDGTPSIKFFYHVLAYMMTGDPSVVPEIMMNGLLDNMDQAVKATGSDIMQNRQTLGGLVWNVTPLGRVFVDNGDTDGKGVAAVPFEILAPWFV